VEKVDLRSSREGKRERGDRKPPSGG